LSGDEKGRERKHHEERKTKDKVHPKSKDYGMAKKSSQRRENSGGPKKHRKKMGDEPGVLR